MNHLHIQAILLGCKNIISNNKTTIFLLIDVLDPTGFWLLQSTLQLSDLLYYSFGISLTFEIIHLYSDMIMMKNTFSDVNLYI